MNGEAEPARSGSPVSVEHTIQSAYVGRDIKHVAEFHMHTGDSKRNSKVAKNYRRHRARLLPYAVDRRAQRDAFSLAIEQALTGKKLWPQFFVSIGYSSDCVQSLNERLYSSELPETLMKCGRPKQVLVKAMQWPELSNENGEPVDEITLFAELQRAMTAVIGVRMLSERNDLVRALVSQKTTMYVHFDLPCFNIKDGHKRNIELSIRWITELFKERNSNIPFILAPRIVLKDPGWASLGRGDQREVIARAWKDISANGSLEKWLTVLPPLGPVKHADASNWTSRYTGWAKQQPADLEKRVLDFFSHGLFRTGNRSTSMAETAKFLQKLIDEMDISVPLIDQGTRNS